jgi:hypothetical protein
MADPSEYLGMSRSCVARKYQGDQALILRISFAPCSQSLQSIRVLIYQVGLFAQSHAFTMWFSRVPAPSIPKKLSGEEILVSGPVESETLHGIQRSIFKGLKLIQGDYDVY